MMSAADKMAMSTMSHQTMLATSRAGVNPPNRAMARSTPERRANGSSVRSPIRRATHRKPRASSNPIKSTNKPVSTAGSLSMKAAP